MKLSSLLGPDMSTDFRHLERVTKMVSFLQGIYLTVQWILTEIEAEVSRTEVLDLLGPSTQTGW